MPIFLGINPRLILKSIRHRLLPPEIRALPPINPATARGTTYLTPT
jgi:hypothetical protein